MKSPPDTVTLDAVARMAGVSPSTVSRILNGSARVSQQKTQAVERAIAELGFRPNPIARSLAGGRSHSIGVLTQAVDSPFYGEALRGIEDRLRGEGYIPLFASGNWNPADEAQALEVLLSRRVDGIIMLEGAIAGDDLLQVTDKVPTILIGRSERLPSPIQLSFDHLHGGRLATRHLIELGHRRIAHISGDLSHHDAADRLTGYRVALQEAGLNEDPVLVLEGDFREASGFRLTTQLVESGVDFSAIFAANDQMAAGALLALWRKGLRVPDDVSVIGFDDIRGASFSLPPLTTIRQPMYEIGQVAAGGIMAWVVGESPAMEVPLPAIVVRESTRRLR